jgi:hypothetical protein
LINKEIALEMVDNSQDQGFKDEDDDIDEEAYDYPA